MAATRRVLFESVLVKLSDFTCDTPRSGCGCELCDRLSSITIIRRGVHAHHARGQVALAEPGRALLYRGGESYRLSHPYERAVSDRSTCIEFGPSLLEEAFGAAALQRDFAIGLPPATLRLNLDVMAAAVSAGADTLAAAEAVLALIGAVARDFGAAPLDRLRPSSRRRVERARAFIAASPAANHSLEEVAAAAASSPFHLARLFRRATGMTLRGYRRRLRLALALEALAEGADDLARVAVRAGFADHSHLTNAFKDAFGLTPRALRESLRSGGLMRQSRFFQAAAAGRA